MKGIAYISRMKTKTPDNRLAKTKVIYFRSKGIEDIVEIQRLYLVTDADKDILENCKVVKTFKEWRLCENSIVFWAKTFEDIIEIVKKIKLKINN